MGGFVVANTSVHGEVAKWISSNWLERQYKQKFQRRKATLTLGGDHEFSAVSNDGTIISCIITSQLKTPSASAGTGKISKVWAELYFLTHTEAETRLVLFTEHDMYSYFISEVENKRVPATIKFHYVDIKDEDLRQRLMEARKTASLEMRHPK